MGRMEWILDDIVKGGVAGFCTSRDIDGRVERKLKLKFGKQIAAAEISEEGNE